jgi:DNA replicative helicase MCM subunit Mcm2 (Cdc46/Mcm family)
MKRTKDGQLENRRMFHYLSPYYVIFSDKIVTMLFLRKYIHMAKAVRPKLTEPAAAYISACYTDLRSFDTTKSDRERVSVAPNFVQNVFYFYRQCL